LTLEANTTSKLDDIISRLQDQFEGKHLPELRDSLIELSKVGSAVLRQQQLLRRLRFNSIKVRQDAIKPAHAETFKWIFESSHSNFRKWLHSGQGVYWIAGKAGSGKSTLMKWVHRHALTLSSLQEWAGTNKLILGSHFFWNSGSSLQKSEEGLLRTLLCQLFKECPALIEKIWPDGEDFDHEWNVQSLRTAIEKISHIPFPTEKFCIFVDGLDEYSGRHQDLILTIKRLASSPSIKVCASSRPWNVFSDAFGRSTNKFRLEDLTRDDIKKYVAKNLKEDVNFMERESSNPLLNQIAEDVTKRARGVFLWVYLVVESLKKGLIDGAKLHEMKQMLDSLPSDLEEYFQHMIESIEEYYRQESVRIFRVATVALQPLPLIAYELLEAEHHNPNYALQAEIKPYSQDQLEDIWKTMKKRLNARCKDLLEVIFDAETFDRHPYSPWCYRVDFLHRTVREFFRKTDDTFETLGKWKPDDFDVELSLCRVSIALLKVFPTEIESHLHFGDILCFVDEFNHHARTIETHYSHGTVQNKGRLEHEFKLLDEMDRVNTRLFEMSNTHWTNVRPIRINSSEKTPQGELLKQYEEHGFHTFIASTIQAGLTLYVGQKLETRHIQEKKGRPLLDYALRPWMVSQLELPDLQNLPNPMMVQLLLQRGSDPNQGMYDPNRRIRPTGYTGNTVWILFLLRPLIVGSLTPEDTKEMYMVCKLLLEHGADLRYLKPDYDGFFLRDSFWGCLVGLEMEDQLEALEKNRQKKNRQKDKSVLKKISMRTKALWNNNIK
jgi:hypothetical protein